jgi:hypothetical protein
MPQNTENEPRLVNPVALNVWREVYNGRWADLRIVQKAEFVIEVVFGDSGTMLCTPLRTSRRYRRARMGR